MPYNKPSLLKETLHKLVQAGICITLMRPASLRKAMRDAHDEDFSVDVDVWYKLPVALSGDDNLFFCEDSENRVFIMNQTGFYWESETTDEHQARERSVENLVKELFEEVVNGPFVEGRWELPRHCSWVELALAIGSFTTTDSGAVIRERGSMM